MGDVRTLTAVLDWVAALIETARFGARTQEAADKLGAVLVVPHGFHAGPDQVVVMGYFEPVEGEKVDTKEFVYDETPERLAADLRAEGIACTMESNFVLDPGSGKPRPAGPRGPRGSGASQIAPDAGRDSTGPCDKDKNQSIPHENPWRRDLLCPGLPPGRPSSLL